MSSPVSNSQGNNKKALRQVLLSTPKDTPVILKGLQKSATKRKKTPTSRKSLSKRRSKAIMEDDDESMRAEYSDNMRSYLSLLNSSDDSILMPKPAKKSKLRAVTQAAQKASSPSKSPETRRSSTRLKNKMEDSIILKHGLDYSTDQSLSFEKPVRKTKLGSQTTGASISLSSDAFVRQDSDESKDSLHLEKSVKKSKRLRQINEELSQNLFLMEKSQEDRNNNSTLDESVDSRINKSAGSKADSSANITNLSLSENESDPKRQALKGGLAPLDMTASLFTRNNQVSPSIPLQASTSDVRALRKSSRISKDMVLSFTSSEHDQSFSSNISTNSKKDKEVSEPMEADSSFSRKRQSDSRHSDVSDSASSYTLRNRSIREDGSPSSKKKKRTISPSILNQEEGLDHSENMLPEKSFDKLSPPTKVKLFGNTSQRSEESLVADISATSVYSLRSDANKSVANKTVMSENAEYSTRSRQDFSMKKHPNRSSSRQSTLRDESIIGADAVSDSPIKGGSIQDDPKRPALKGGLAPLDITASLFTRNNRGSVSPSTPLQTSTSDVTAMRKSTGISNLSSPTNVKRFGNTSQRNQEPRAADRSSTSIHSPRSSANNSVVNETTVSKGSPSPEKSLSTTSQQGSSMERLSNRSSTRRSVLRNQSISDINVGSGSPRKSGTSPVVQASRRLSPRVAAHANKSLEQTEEDHLLSPSMGPIRSPLASPNKSIHQSPNRSVRHTSSSSIRKSHISSGDVAESSTNNENQGDLSRRTNRSPITPSNKRKTVSLDIAPPTSQGSPSNLRSRLSAMRSGNSTIFSRSVAESSTPSSSKQKSSRNIPDFPKESENVDPRAKKQLTLDAFLQRMKKDVQPVRPSLPTYPTKGATQPSISSQPKPRKTKKLKLRKIVPSSFHKNAMTHFAKHKVTRAGFEEVDSVADEFLLSLAADLKVCAYSRNSSTVTLNDVVRLSKQLGLFTSEKHMHQLIKEFLPTEMWENIVPTTLPHGKSLP